MRVYRIMKYLPMMNFILNKDNFSSYFLVFMSIHNKQLTNIN